MPLVGYEPVIGRMFPTGQVTTCVTLLKTCVTSVEQRNRFFYDLNTNNSTTLTKAASLFHFSFLLAISCCVLYAGEQYQPSHYFKL
jgi:hypothetical protein